jgi:hypothetical protein
MRRKRHLKIALWRNLCRSRSGLSRWLNRQSRVRRSWNEAPRTGRATDARSWSTCRGPAGLKRTPLSVGLQSAGTGPPSFRQGLLRHIGWEFRRVTFPEVGGAADIAPSAILGEELFVETDRTFHSIDPEG